MSKHYEWPAQISSVLFWARDCARGNLQAAIKRFDDDCEKFPPNQRLDEIAAQALGGLGPPRATGLYKECAGCDGGRLGAVYLSADGSRAIVVWLGPRQSDIEGLVNADVDSVAPEVLMDAHFTCGVCK